MGQGRSRGLTLDTRPSLLWSGASVRLRWLLREALGGGGVAAPSGVLAQELARRGAPSPNGPGDVINSGPVPENGLRCARDRVGPGAAQLTPCCASGVNQGFRTALQIPVPPHTSLVARCTQRMAATRTPSPPRRRPGPGGRSLRSPPSWSALVESQCQLSGAASIGPQSQAQASAQPEQPRSDQRPARG